VRVWVASISAGVSVGPRLGSGGAIHAGGAAWATSTADWVSVATVCAMPVCVAPSACKVAWLEASLGLKTSQDREMNTIASPKLKNLPRLKKLRLARSVFAIAFFKLLNTFDVPEFQSATLHAGRWNNEEFQLFDCIR
jgi:hypothetical protein